MPRKNRQKLHRELRLRAEAHQARLRARRAAAGAALARVEAPRPAAEPEPPQVLRPTWAAVSELLGLAGIDGELKLRVRKVVEVVADALPDQCGAWSLPWFLLLAQQPWVRKVRAFRAPDGDVRARRDAFAAHLLVKWPVPAFLYRSLDVGPLAIARSPVEDRWAVDVLAGVGRGGSLRRLGLATPLTRAMAHAFLAAPPDATPVEALRDAQVAGFRGSPRLAVALRSTLLGVYRGEDDKLGEPFWHAVIGWLAARPWVDALPVEELGDLLRWIEASQWERLAARAEDRGEAAFTLTGRTEGSVRRSVEAWKARAAAIGKPPFTPSGIPPWSEGTWSVRELADEAALVEEGRAMHHCVHHYADLVRSRKIAIFSLLRGKSRIATLEVALGTRRVVQGKLACNAALGPAEQARVAAWAEASRLSVG